MIARSGAMRGAPIVTSFALVATIGLVDGLLTKPDAWSAALERPSWHPPAAAFGPIWGVVMICVALGAATAWEQMSSSRERSRLLALFAVNGAFNVLWSLLFFVGHRPDWALVDIALLWLSIAAILAFLKPRAPAAALWISPYLVWITIATALNVELVRLNAPF